MKKIVFSVLLLSLLCLALTKHTSGNDFSDMSDVLVSKLSESPLAVEVFSISEGEAQEV